MWIKSGNFLIAYDSGSGLNRSVTFTHAHQDAAIKEVRLLGYCCNKIRIMLTASNSDAYRSLVQLVVNAGFLPPDSEQNRSMTIDFSANNPLVMSTFINVIKNVEGFSEIEGAICQSFDIDLTVSAPIPSWITHGDFLYYPGEHEEGEPVHIDRSITYENIRTDAPIRKVSLTSYYISGYLSLSVTASSPEHFHALSQTLMGEGISSYESTHMFQLEFNETTRESYNRFICLIQSVTNIDDFLTGMNIHVDTKLRTLVRDARFRAPPTRRPALIFFNRQDQDLQRVLLDSVQSPLGQVVRPVDFGANAQTLKDMNYAGEIPELFLCSITNDIMTDPVFDPNHPQFVFEFKTIARSLESRCENPFTRTPLILNQLVSKSALKNEINQFIINIGSELTQASLPK